MPSATPAVAMLYDDSAYVETLRTVCLSGDDRPMGPVGRQVAGREFLDSHLNHGDYSDLRAIVWNQGSADALAGLCRQYPRASQRALHTLPVDRFLGRGDGNVGTDTELRNEPSRGAPPSIPDLGDGLGHVGLLSMWPVNGLDFGKRAARKGA